MGQNTAKWAYDNERGTLTAPTAYGTYTAEMLVKISEHVKDLKEEADILKASVMIDGAEYVAIERALEDAMDDTYKKGDITNTLNKADEQIALWDRQNELTGADKSTDVKVNNRKYNTVAKWTAALNNVKNQKHNGTYEQKFYDELRAVKNDTVKAVNNAKTIAEAEAAFTAGYEKFDAILSLADRSAAAITKDYADMLKKYNNELDAYMVYKTNLLSKTGTAKDYSWNSNTMLRNLKDTLASSYTTEELTTNYEAAKKAIDDLQTSAALEATKAEIIKRVQALPKTITVADKETVGTLKKDLDAHNEYCETIGNTAAKIVMAYAQATDNAYEKVKQLEAEEIKADIKAIGKVTLEDEAAIKAITDKLDAYVTYYAGEDAQDFEIAALRAINYNGTTVADLNTDLEAAKVKEFKVMVGKLPADGSDVAGIKAARAAYEKLNRNSQYVVYRSSFYDKLLDLEKIVVESVKGLKITVSSKATKGVMTIKWKVRGNKAAANGYQVYRSTKKDAGFKKMITTSKMTYKNTKGLKKGVTYYYKVRAYARVDGKLVFSDWSNKAHRKAK